MGTQESLSLPHRFEPSHSPLTYSGSLMRLLRSIILILFSTVGSLRDQLSVSDAITAQFISHDLSGLISMAS